MKLSTIKTTMEYKLSGAKAMPDDDNLASLFFEAMYYVACKCVPNELLRTADTAEDVLRNIEDGAFIAVPDMPDFTSTLTHLMIDEDLTYACINYVCFLITQNADFKALCDFGINEFIANYGREYYVGI